MRKTLCVLLALFVLAMLPATAQFHHNTGLIVWTWPIPVDANSPENQQKLKDVTAWLKKHGTPGSYALAFYRFDPVPVAGGENPPNWPYLIFCKDWAGPQPVMQFDRTTFDAWLRFEDDPACSVHDFALALKSPPVLLTELQHRFQFGNPTVGVPYPDPPDPQQPPVPSPPPARPANPVGKEFLPGKFYVLDPLVMQYADERGKFLQRTRETPFGTQRWFEKVQ